MTTTPNPEAFVAGLKTALSSMGAEVYDFWRDSVNPPCINTFMAQMPRDATQHAEFVSVVMVGMDDEASGQSQCYDIATQAANLVDANHTLSGAVSSAWCRTFRNSRPWPVQEGRQRMWSLEVVWDVYLTP